MGWNCEEPLHKLSSNFLVIGHAGGNPQAQCENTLDATRAAIGAVNAVEIDLSMSKDGVVFLWHDPDPTSPGAVARRCQRSNFYDIIYVQLIFFCSLGLFTPGRCRPVFKSKKPAHLLTFAEIQRFWSYSDKHAQIPTLDEWLDEFAYQPSVELFWLDVKVNEPQLLLLLAREISHLLERHSVPMSRVSLSIAKDHLLPVLRHSLSTAGMDPRRTVSDTMSHLPWVSRTTDYDGVKKAFWLEGISPPCGPSATGCCASLGAPPVAINRRSALRHAVRANVRRRDREAPHVSIFVWTIDDKADMLSLVKAGVDGIITNKPWVLAGLLRSISRA